MSVRGGRDLSFARWCLLVGALSMLLATVLRAARGTAFVTGLDDGAQLFCAAGASFAASRAGRRAPDRRRAWWFLSVATGAWASGQLVWAYYECWARRSTPFPSVADAGFLVAVPLALLGLVGFIESESSIRSRVLGLLEGAIIALSLLIVSWMLVFQPVAGEAAGSLFARAVSLAYPTGDCALLAVVLFAITRRRTRSQGPLRLLGAGYAAIAIADSAFAVLSQKASYSTGGLVDLGWIVGFATIALAASARDSDAAAAARTHQHQPWAFGLPYLPVVIAGAAAAVRMIDGDLDATTIWVAIVLVMVLCIHQFAVLAENSALTSNLEARVDERTAELLAREQEFAALVEHSSDVTFVLDRERRITYVSPSARTVLDLDPAGLTGRQFEAIVDLADRASTRAAIRVSAGTEGRPQRYDVQLVGGEGRLHHSELTVTNLLAEPALRGIVVNCRDVSERRALEDRLRYDALHDALTGLANRRLLIDHLSLALERRRDPRRPKNAGSVALLLVDLDDFKAVNDGLGHPAGDELLVAVGERLRECVRPGDTVARLGGDEFALLLVDVEAELVATSAQRMLEVLQLPVSVADIDVTVPASIGVRVMQDSDTPQMLIRDADIALYAAKSAGKNCYEVFDVAMGEQASRRLALKADLRGAWGRGEMSVVYQPIVHLDSGGLRGAEALLRWTHPQFGTVSPEEFIPLAEETGTIVALGVDVLRAACRQAAAWRGRGGFTYMSVNVSPVQLDESYVDAVDAVLRESGLEPERLVLEVTEGVILSNVTTAVDVLQELRRRGIRVAIDDFGTGYSSLAYAQQLPIDLVKIDRAFTREVTNPSSVVPAIVQLARVLGAQVIAEGVEEVEHVQALSALRCEFGQGYLYSRPLPAASFEELLRAGIPVP